MQIVLSHIYLCIYKNSEVDFWIYSSYELYFQLIFNMAFIVWLMQLIFLLT